MIPLIYIPILFAGSGILHIHSMIRRQISISGTRHLTIIRLLVFHGLRLMRSAGGEPTYMNTALRKNGIADVQAYRLPLETEWEYAARGGLDLSMYPWGGPYTRNYQGCFLANFKPLRGNYIDDGTVYTAKVGSYEPNEYGLFDMSGNVAEWTLLCISSISIYLSARP